MLLELTVKDFAIIDQLQLQFEEGLNILSGETGAGKSILVRSLGLLMGGKSHAEDIRQGKEQAVVEGRFDLRSREDVIESLSGFGLTVDDEQELIVRRLFSRDGKNKVYINGHLCSLADLKNIVAPLVEVTGRSTPLIEMTTQSENKNLLSSAYHLDLLDQSCENQPLRKKVSDLYSRLQKISTQMEEIQAAAPLRTQRMDFIQYQLNEIEALALDPESDSNLPEKIQSLKGQQNLAEFYQQSTELLDNEILARLLQLLNSSQKLKFKSASLNEVLDLLQDAQKKLQEASYQLSSYQPNDQDGKDVDSLESRLSDIRKLQKKFGESIADILSAQAQLKNEYQQLENQDQRWQQLELEKKAVFAELSPLCRTLTEGRTRGAQRLVKKVNQELIDLNMKGVHFGIQLETLPEISASGMDSVLFTIKNGDKGDERPLHKTASGGELSRILLSLKIAVGTLDHPRCYLFDEVDTGVSGPTAQKVGKKLKWIAQGQQVICITHLPQVASFGDQHYLIAKKSQKGLLATEVKKLQGSDRVEEIARLISGEKISATSRAHAKQLLDDAKN